MLRSGGDDLHRKLRHGFRRKAGLFLVLVITAELIRDS